MQALILAAGRGNRMRPFSDFIPKPLLPIKGKAVILHSLETLQASGFKKVVITVGYFREKVLDFVEKYKPAGLKVEYAYQKGLLGSADAIKVALDKINEDFLVLAGDTVFPLSGVKKIIKAFKSGESELVVGLKYVEEKDLREKSSTLVDSQGFLLKVIEKPKEGEELSNVSVAPIYFFRYEVISDYLNKLKPNPAGVYELATALQSMIDDGKRIKGVFIQGTRDITRPEDVLKYNFPYLRPFF